MTHSRQENTSENAGRYRAIEYGTGETAVTIIQDSRNDRAWIQSDRPMELRP